MTLINEKTKISQLLKANPDALEAIISISPDFKKLRNPVLRRLMAGRTTIKMASKIGGCLPKDFLIALSPLGFEWDDSDSGEEEIARKPFPQYLNQLSKAQIVVLDVRSMIQNAEDPLRPIQKKIKELQPEQALCVINTFEPAPLISLLEKQGYQAFVDQVEAERFDTYFYREDGSGFEEIKTEAISHADDWEATLKHWEGRMLDVDVRQLEMPGPMMTILETLESMPDEKALYVYHKKVPIFLLTELKDRGYEYRIKDVKEGEVYLIIFKKQV